MINPFDASFFKFLIGFVCILIVSFTVLFFADNFGEVTDSATANTKGLVEGVR